MRFTTDDENAIVALVDGVRETLTVNAGSPGAFMYGESEVDLQPPDHVLDEAVRRLRANGVNASKIGGLISVAALHDLVGAGRMLRDWARDSFFWCQTSTKTREHGLLRTSAQFGQFRQRHRYAKQRILPARLSAGAAAHVRSVLVRPIYNGGRTRKFTRASDTATHPTAVFGVFLRSA